MVSIKYVGCLKHTTAEYLFLASSY